MYTTYLLDTKLLLILISYNELVYQTTIMELLILSHNFTKQVHL